MQRQKGRIGGMATASTPLPLSAHSSTMLTAAPCSQQHHAHSSTMLVRSRHDSVRTRSLVTTSRNRGDTQQVEVSAERHSFQV